MLELLCSTEVKAHFSTKRKPSPLEVAEIPVKHCVSARDAEQIQVPFPLKVTMAAAMRKKAWKKYFILAAQKPLFQETKTWNTGHKNNFVLF